jgi:hypothetical protein
MLFVIVTKTLRNQIASFMKKILQVTTVMSWLIDCPTPPPPNISSDTVMSWLIDCPTIIFQVTTVMSWLIDCPTLIFHVTTVMS